MSDRCKFCNGDYVDEEWPPDSASGLCVDCRMRWFHIKVETLVREMEENNCYKGDGVLCTCGKSEARYRRLLSLCGVPCTRDDNDGPTQGGMCK